MPPDWWTRRHQRMVKQMEEQRRQGVTPDGADEQERLAANQGKDKT